MYYTAIVISCIAYTIFKILRNFLERIKVRIAAEWYPKNTSKTQMKNPLTVPYILLIIYPANNDNIPWGRLRGTKMKYPKYIPINPYV